MNNLAYINFPEYLKMLVGLQDDSQGSFFFKTCIDTTYNWDNGPVKDFLYNDNRIVIRIHSLLHFIAFGSYFVHALFSCFFSFIGLFFIYRAFREYFQGKEKVFFLILCLFPTLWLYTGGLLKEGLTILFLGLILFSLKKLLQERIQIKNILLFIPLLFISLLLKPYILFYALLFFGLFQLISRTSLKFKSLIFIGSLISTVILVNFAAIAIKKKSLLQAAYQREKEFMDLSTGGIFLLDSVKFVRVPYDTNLVERVFNKPDSYRIKKGVHYTYWEHTHQQDTLYCAYNTNSASTYSLVYILPKAGSTINVIQGSSNFPVIIARSFYYTMLHPFFYNAKSAMQLFASFENLFLIVCVIISFIGLLISKSEKLPAIAFILFGISLFIMIGISTPNSGAIMRYRSPAAVFIIISALYFIPLKKLSAGFLKKHAGQ